MAVAIVTGSDSGIGKASAVALAKAGFDVGITWHRDRKGAEGAAARHTLTVDLDGAFLTAQRAARRMVKQGRGGRIILITSVHEHVPLVGSSAYCAAKGGLGMLTKVMAAELGQHGITVNAIAPGEIATPMTDQHNVDPFKEKRPGYPLGRPGSAHEVAGLVTFLTSEPAAFITGASIVIDGGLELTGGIGAHAIKDDSWRKV